MSLNEGEGLLTYTLDVKCNLLRDQFRRVVAGMKWYRQTVFLYFVEREKAFDRVMLDELLDIMANKN
jgi:hypothetical protein